MLSRLASNTETTTFRCNFSRTLPRYWKCPRSRQNETQKMWYELVKPISGYNHTDDTMSEIAWHRQLSLEIRSRSMKLVKLLQKHHHHAKFDKYHICSVRKQYVNVKFWPQTAVQVFFLCTSKTGEYNMKVIVSRKNEYNARLRLSSSSCMAWQISFKGHPRSQWNVLQNYSITKLHDCVHIKKYIPIHVKAIQNLNPTG